VLLVGQNDGMHPQLHRVRHHALIRLLPLLLRPAGGSLVRLGTSYGGWWVPVSKLEAGRVAYCAGAGEDISFDLALHERGLQVFVFDPTPRAIDHVGRHGPVSNTFTFLPIGWWSESTTLRFFAPRNEAHVSHSVVNLQETDRYFEAEVCTVAEAMRDLSHAGIDILKMDIEGAEFAVLQSLMRDAVYPGVLCVEFDQPCSVRRIVAAVRSLSGYGYALRHIDVWNYTFERRSSQKNGSAR